jgi:hypothetical protein
MPMYVYETTDSGPRVELVLYQSIKDAPLTHDPESARPIRRVITGGMEIPRGKKDPVKTYQARHSNSCACCNPRPTK